MMTDYVRTTIKLREDIYQTLKKEAGVKNLSEKINEILIKILFKEKKSLFGTMPEVDLSALRDSPNVIADNNTCFRQEQKNNGIDRGSSF